jgi:aminodeoxyfutalosine synthase
MEGVTPQQILENPDLIAAGMAGDDVRRRMHGAKTTFVRVLEMHVDAMPSALPARLSAGEIRLVGVPSSLDLAVTAVRAAAALAGSVPVTGFSVFDLQGLEPSLGEVCTALRAAGLAGVTHLQIDSVTNPHEAARAVQGAGLLLGTISVQVIGDDERIAVCDRAAELQDAVGGFRAFAPLQRTQSVAQPTTGYDDVKMVALARVIVTNIPSIQVDWQLYGPKMAQVALTVGADDVDNVSAVDPGVLGTRRSPLEEIKGNITAAGLEPIERDGLFNPRQA